MTMKYDAAWHSHALVSPPGAEASPLWRYPLPVVLYTASEHAWVPGTTKMLEDPEVRIVGPGSPLGETWGSVVNADGGCVVAVPASWCRFLTSGEAYEFTRGLGGPTKKRES